MAGSRDNRQVLLPTAVSFFKGGDQRASKSQDDPYKTLCDDVKSFIRSFYKHIKSNDLAEIENDYVIKYAQLYWLKIK